MEDNWNELKQWIATYARNHGEEIEKYPGDPPMRYCVSISCQDLLEKMEQIENRNNR